MSRSADVAAIVLVAGLGTRIRPLTTDHPKCLLPVAGRSIGSRTIASLKAAGVTRIVLVVGHGAQLVRECLDTQGVEFVENAEFMKSGTAYSTALGMQYLDSTGPPARVLILEGDVVTDPQLLLDLLSSPAEHATLVAPWTTDIDGSTVEAGQDGIVRSWMHTSDRSPAFDPQGSWKLVNVHVFGFEFARGHFLNLASTDMSREASLETVLGSSSGLGPEVHIVPTRGRAWVEVDDVRDLARAELLFGEV